MEKCLEWCTELPLLTKPQESTTFMIQDTECFFYFYRIENYYYVLLKSKTAFGNLKSFFIGVHMLFYNGSYNYYRTEHKLQNSNKHICLVELCSAIHETSLEESNFVRFIFMFEYNVRLLLSCDTKIENKLSDVQLLDSKFSIENLPRDLGWLLHDAEIKCEDYSWKIHKIVVTIQSKVLQAIFESNMIGERIRTITIQDMDVPSVQLLLEYLYCGKLRGMTVNTAEQFYEIGDKYAIERLKELCSNYLINNLSPENACRILILAEKHSHSSFKERVIDYMIDTKIFLNDTVWPNFWKRYPEIAVQVYNKYCRIVAAL